MNILKIILFLLIFVVTVGCSRYEEIDLEESIWVLESHFVYIQEMSDIKGKRKCKGFACDQRFKIGFRLPNTMAPEDWLSYLATEISSKHNRNMKPNNKFEYEYISADHSDPSNAILRYYPGSGKYYEAEALIGD